MNLKSALPEESIMKDNHDQVDDEAQEARATATEAMDPEEARRQRDEYYDLLLRKTAEFDNYRKRIERERQSTAQAAAADLIVELLPLIDDLERALRA
jgi:molecular chaperone GrpE